ncbi:hypothetical protein FNV43_RR17039 [Rhamnella rubrinervis]|uniref:Uncharacterized protein n=1 Tax=Rhamnella rubrinervis TaxID=2594499 RepID=A0A8K0H016_9ROSA|nr:hypothetical protein FNV43_RR17039 [Rhamnella rubrinervis]
MAEENGESSTSREEQEEALVALIEHRTREVQHLHNRIFYYQSQLKEAEQRLNDSQSKLARLRGRSDATSSKSHLDNGTKTVKVEHRSTSPIHKNDGSSRKQSQSKPELLIPAVTPKISQPTKLAGSGPQASALVSSHSYSPLKAKGEKPSIMFSQQEVTESQDKGMKRKFEQKEHRELIPLVRSSVSPCIIQCQSSNHITSQHKRKLRSIALCPVNDQLFVTSALDGFINLWQVQSRVMGVAGMQQKPIVLSTGADKRIIGFDAHVGRAEFKHQIESKCMSILPNPCDFNLFMVQAGTPERQLRLFDIRLRQTEIHAFGWKQESSESQSALINQAWSPDGLYITSGSADPRIHIFDIRYNAQKPSQSIKAHQRRVFKAVWLHSIPLLISISSDLNIGLHKTS